MLYKIQQGLDMTRKECDPPILKKHSHNELSFTLHTYSPEMPRGAFESRGPGPGSAPYVQITTYGGRFNGEIVKVEKKN